MNTAKDHLKADMHKEPEQLQREADDVRADFEHTIDELANQFSPGELFNQAVTRFRNGDSAFITNLSDQIRNNPIPAILAGASIAWLMSASKQPPVRPSRSSGHGVSDKVGAARDRMSAAASHARSTTHDMTAGVKEQGHRVTSGASDLGHRASEASHRTMDKARHGVQTARDNYHYMIEEQPLVVGALAIAVGAALGAMLPRTSTEDELIGEYSDKQRDELKHKAEHMKEKAEETVESKLHEQQHATGQSSSAGSSGDGASTGQLRDSATPTSHTQGQDAPASVNSPAAGASGPGSAGAAGAKGSSTGTDEETGIPAREPSPVPQHPGTNPPDNNRSGINR